MKKTALLLLSVLYFCFAYPQFMPNSIGVCYLNKDSADYHILTIVLPFQTLVEHSLMPIHEYHKMIDSIGYEGQITLFDNTGALIQIENKFDFILEFWCENDGGIQYRPTLSTKIQKTNFKRPLSAIAEIQDICCFVILNRSKQKTEVTHIPSTVDVALMGDYNSDGNIDCLIWTDNDLAGNCDSEPPNNLRIMLQAGHQNFRMRCCGP